MGLRPVENASVWNHIRILFLGSALLFLINIFFGFDNALTPPETIIPRWQVLVHLHAGTIGWITLSVIGLMIWVFSAGRELTDSYVRGVQALVWTGVIVFGSYITSFGLAFNFLGSAFILLPIFGTLSALVIWWALIFSLAQLRRQPVVTTVHLLVVGALLVVAVMAILGVLIGLEHVIGFFVPGADRIGVHAGLTTLYLALAATAIVEGLVTKKPDARWTGAGLAQVLALTIAAFLFLGGILLFLEVLFLLGIILVILGTGLFLARAGRFALARNPLGSNDAAWVFFGTAWLVVSVTLALVTPDPAALPRYLLIVFIHVAFVGMMTNLLLGLYASRTREVGHLLRSWEAVSILLINLGLLVFFLFEIVADARLGAVVMGIGVLLGVLTMITRLGATGGASHGTSA